MKINFAKPAMNLDGSPILDEKGTELFLSKQIGNLIFQTPEKEDPLGTYELAKKIYTSTEAVDFSKAEVDKIKQRVKEGFIAGFSGQVLELISDADKKTK